MAKIGIANIHKVELTVWQAEREYDSNDIDPRLSAIYIEKKYHNAPKTRQEADAQGKRDFNGLMSSFPVLQEYCEPGKTSVYAFIAPTRYLIGQAMRDLVQKRKDEGKPLSQQEISDMSPNMANVSLLVPVKVGGQYFILSQIKGKALGSGEIHAGLVAGNVNAKYLSQPDPLAATLRKEASQELGLDLSNLDLTSIVFLIDESETGQVNFASVARNPNMEAIMGTYEASTKAKLPNPLEVMGLSFLPVAGIALVPLEKGANGLKDITCFHPTPNGLEKKIENRGVRPYTQAVLDYISNPENVRFLLEKAGF